MRLIIFLILILFSLTQSFALDQKYLYILNDKCIEELYFDAKIFFKNSEIAIIKDSRGIILRSEIKNPTSEFYELTTETYKKAILIESFLAKIQKSAIIEVHMGEVEKNYAESFKRWEISTVIANKIESVILKRSGKVIPTKINSVGYGEFLPIKNTSNNGGKYLNRLDIIILCNISGE